MKGRKTPVYAEVTQRQHFNYLRNNSSSLYSILNWQNNQPVTNQVFHRVNTSYNPYPQSTNQSQYNHPKQYSNNKKIAINQNDQSFEPQSYSKEQQANEQNLKNRKKALKKNKQPNRPVSAPKFNQQKTKQQQEINQLRNIKKLENKKKVQQYIESMIPYSRQLTNSKFQEYFNKPAPQLYGRGNTHQPCGGIIYGNHLKTFNINPHSYANDPKYYQTYETSLNYGKRTKLNQQGRYTHLQRTLTKKLGLNEYNHVLKQGKVVNYVDVDDSNMNIAMRENNQFIKNHRDQIRSAQNQYKKQKQAQKQLEREQFYNQKLARKQENLNKTLNKSTMVSSFFEGKSQQQRVKQQVIYRHHDQHGNVRLAADRHGITCYVDMNFPQNDAAYTAHLNSIKQIFPIPTKPQDRNLDVIRIENYGKSLENLYPSHYLLPNCQQPEIIKMYENKMGVGHQRKQRVKSPNKGKKNITKINKSREQAQTNLKKQQESYNRKSEQKAIQPSPQQKEINANQRNQIMKRAWGDNKISESILDDRNRSRKGDQGNHLPLNQKDPHSYKKASDQIGHVPYAGMKK